jgi:translation initiation factor IF-1
VSREDIILVEGQVIEGLPNRMVRIELSNGYRFLARLGNRLMNERITLQTGDKVRVEMSPFDLSKGSVVEHLNGLRYESKGISEKAL